MTIKIAITKNNEHIISDVKELSSEDNFKGYLLKNPQIVSFSKNENLLLEEVEDTVKIILSPWIPLSKDSEIFVIPDYIVAIVEPLDMVKEIYLEKTKEND